MPEMVTHPAGPRRRRVAASIATAIALAVPTPIGADSESDGATVSARAHRVAVPDDWFRTALDPSAGTDGWELEVSHDRARIVDRGDRLECTAGGFGASTHYARTRRRLPETDGLTARKSFTIVADIELPSDFYDRHESYVRLVTTDNHPARLRSSGEQVGAATSDEWRVGFLIYAGDELPRLVSEHENREAIVLWEGARRLPVGRHVVEIRFTPSRASEGGYTLLIDGEVVGEGSSMRTVPRSVSSAEVAVTRVGACLDGAAGQDDRSLTMSLRSPSFAAER